jgi:preprotein translocase subunit SecA
MFTTLARKVFGSANERMVQRLRRQVEMINGLEATLTPLSDEALRGKTVTFRQQLEQGRDLDDLLPEAFAVVREGARRALGLRHFDVQLIGGMVQHQGMISEMRTGEGKTLVATAPVYLNALTGRGVHVVTVNDYLARRDAEWMGQVYGFLGLSVGCIIHGLTDPERQAQYACDVTYATNNELGFDYLRDNMKFSRAQMVQRQLNFAIVDEVDSILVDEARTPLIISGPAETSSELYKQLDVVVRKLEAECYEIDEKQKNLTITEHGSERLEQLLEQAGLLKDGTLFDLPNIPLLHHGQQALRAHRLFERDKDYIVKDDKIIIIDEFTGRMMEGRRYSEGIHQAIEAKEGVTVQQENQTLATITFQNYFRLYDKLAGMTGTAMTEAAEFEDIYGLQVVDIPTNVAVQRLDEQDEVYRTLPEKNRAILAQIEACQQAQQPVLVGTASIAKSEELSALFTQKNIRHAVLNARYHDREAAIIACAGEPGAVTIATNMAGRGTDIQLGGNLEMQLAAAHNEDGTLDLMTEAGIREAHARARATVLAAGGLCVIGTERHESRRIDNQLRGRSGRQGDPGRSRFYISLEDDLLRIFGSERIGSLLQSLGLEENEAIVHPWLSKSIERAQKKVEARNFDMRKNLLKFDNVMNDQRQVIYEQRLEIMDADDIGEMIDAMQEQTLEDLIARHLPPKSLPEEWSVSALHEDVLRIFALDLPLTAWAATDGITDSEIAERILTAAQSRTAERRAKIPPEALHHGERSIVLQTLDQSWKEHLLAMDHLRKGINLRAYGQRDPLNEYKREAFVYFEGMLERMRETVTMLVSRMDEAAGLFDLLPPELGPMEESHPTPDGTGDPFGTEDALLAGDRGTPTRPTQLHVRDLAPEDFDPRNPATWGRIQRNAPCPCGSGKKYKHCHGMET